MIRLVVDTNVFVSAAIKANSTPYLVVRWLGNHGRLLKTAATEQELFDVLVRPHLASLAPESFRDGLKDLFAKAESIPIRETIAACRDPKDDKFIFWRCMPFATFPLLGRPHSCRR